MEGATINAEGTKGTVMVWTFPTLVAASVLGASLKPTEQTQRAVDSDHDGSEGGDHDDHETDHDVDTE